MHILLLLAWAFGTPVAFAVSPTIGFLMFVGIPTYFYFYWGGKDGRRNRTG